MKLKNRQFWAGGFRLDSVCFPAQILSTASGVRWKYQKK
jgi:hypothetical protein